MLPVITKLIWGIPVSGIGISTAPNESELFFQTSPSPSSTSQTFAQLETHSFRYADGNHFKIPTFFVSAVTSLDNWVLDISKEIVRPPSPSGIVQPIERYQGSVSGYVADAISTLLQKAYTKTRYGLTPSEKEELIGDLWYVLNEANKAKAGRDVFWLHLLDQFMWNALSSRDQNASDRPSWAKTAEPIIEKFLPWFERSVGGEEKAIQLLAIALSTPLSTASFGVLSAGVNNFKRVFPNFLTKPIGPSQGKGPTWGDILIAQVYTDAVLDPQFDLDGKRAFLRQLIEQKTTFSYFSVWDEAYEKAWRESNREAIVRLDLLFLEEGLDKEPANIKILDAWLHFFFNEIIANAMDALEPPQPKLLVDTILILEDPMLKRYQTQFEIQFKMRTRVTGETVENVANFLAVLLETIRIKMAPIEIYYGYKIALLGNYVSWLKNILPIKDGGKRRELVDRVKKADARVPSVDFLGILKKIFSEMAEREIGQILEEESMRTADIRWSLLKTNAADILEDNAGLLHVFLQKVAAQKVAAILDSEKEEEILSSLRFLEDRITLALGIRNDAKILIAGLIYEYLREHLFEDQTIMQRDILLDRLFQSASLEFYLRDSGLKISPWKTGERNPVLREAKRYNTEEGCLFMEQNLKLSVYLGEKDRFLQFLQTAFEKMASSMDPYGKKEFFTGLYKSHSSSLQGVVERAAGAFGITSLV